MELEIPKRFNLIPLRRSGADNGDGDGNGNGDGDGAQTNRQDSETNSQENSFHEKR